MKQLVAGFDNLSRTGGELERYFSADQAVGKGDELHSPAEQLVAIAFEKNSIGSVTEQAVAVAEQVIAVVEQVVVEAVVEQVVAEAGVEQAVAALVKDDLRRQMIMKCLS